MTTPFTRLPFDRSIPFAARPGRAPGAARPFGPATARAGVAAAAALLAAIALPVLADASGDGSVSHRPGQPPAESTVETTIDPQAETPAASPADAPLRCEIALDAVRGGTEITGIVTSDAATVTGDYRLAITSRSAAGQATIRQSGAFHAGPGAPAILGQTRLPGSPASQDVDLTVNVGGARLPCATGL